MTVFKTILKILNRLKGMLILYTIVLLLITVLNQTNKDNVTNFEETKSFLKRICPSDVYYLCLKL